jgi:hypothetical protein|nr:MAG TPA: protein of unknown function (DUF3330) [Caudoviricetes sp.]
MSENIITVKNIKTGEVLEFTGQNAVAKYLTGVYGKKIYAGAVASAIRQDTPYKKTWEINFIKNANKKICDYCGKEYTSNRAKQRFCSDTCREEYHAGKKRGSAINDEAKITKEKLILVHKLVTMLAPLRTAK